MKTFLWVMVGFAFLGAVVEIWWPKMGLSIALVPSVFNLAYFIGELHRYRRQRRLEDQLSTLPRCRHGAVGKERRSCDECAAEAKAFFEEKESPEYTLPRVGKCISCGVAHGLSTPCPVSRFGLTVEVEASVDCTCRVFQDHEPPPAAFKVGQWVRTNDEQLGLVKAVEWINGQYHYQVAERDQDLGDMMAEQSLSYVVPVTGEIWRWMHSNCAVCCPERLGGVRNRVEDFKKGDDRCSMSLTHNEWWAAVKNGCCEPVNFGKGT